MFKMLLLPVLLLLAAGHAVKADVLTCAFPSQDIRFTHWAVDSRNPDKCNDFVEILRVVGSFVPVSYFTDSQILHVTVCFFTRMSWERIMRVEEAGV